MFSATRSLFDRYSLVLFCGILLLAAGSIAEVRSQTVFGRISGTVKDSSGAVVANASVSATNTANNLERKTTSDENGFYTLTNLPAGTYAVAAEQTNFKKAVQDGVSLTADGRLTVDITLEAGLVTETVQVQAALGETVNTTSGELARVVDKRQVQNLALNGRNYMQLVTLVPGAAILDEDQLALTTSLSISQAAINGNRPNYNSLSVDGGFNMDSGSNNSQINNVGVDFIEEVKIQTSNFSAEYGRNAGASVNVVTRGGGNSYHGSAFEFVRNDRLDARNFFSAPKKPKLRFNNFGWNFNGPIKKDRLFFFVGQEYKRIRQDTAPVQRSLPTRAERNGDFSLRTGTLNVPTGYTAINPATGATVAAGQPIPGRLITNLRLNGAPVVISPNGAAIAKVFGEMEKLAAFYVDTPTASNTTFQQPGPFNYREDNVRIDFRYNEKHSMYGRYLHDMYDLIEPYGTFINSQLPTIPTNRLRPGSSYQLSETWLINPKLINEAKINVSFNGQRIPPVGEFWKRETYGFTYPQLFSGGRFDNGIPNTSFAGGAAYSSFQGPSASLLSPTTDIAITDNITWIHNNHSIKAGTTIIRNRKDQNGRSGYTGSLTFNTNRPGSTGNAFADALLGNFRTYNEADNDPIGFFRFSQYEGYAMDSWKVRPNLSLEFGAHLYHYIPTYTQANNMANFDPSLYDPSKAVKILANGNIDPAGGGNRFNGLIRAGGGIPADERGRVSTTDADLALIPAGAPRGFYHPSTKIGPRFGFAYDPFGDSKTSIRGGFGMFYDKVEGNLIFSQLNVAPFVATPQFENGNLTNVSGGTPSALAPFATINAINPNLKVSYSMNFSLGVQRELPHGFFGEVTYVGNQGRHLVRQPDLNAIPFAALVANQPPGPNVNLNALRPYKGFTAISFRLSDANSNYNGLQFYAAKRKGDLELTASYTWSHTLTDTSGNGDGLDVGEDPFNRHYNYGPASFDRRHIFVSTYDYHLPFFRSMKGFGGALLDGWEVSGITRFQSGAYFTVTGNTAIGTRRADYIGGPVLLSNKSNNGWINPAAFAPAPLNRRGSGGVGIAQGPNLQTWDFSARKQVSISERVRLRLQLDMFNAFNRANFRSPDVGFGNLSLDAAGNRIGNGGSSNGNFGKITTAGPARNIQLGLKLNF